MPQDTVAATPPQAIAHAIERRIHERTWGRVRDLRVEQDGDRLVIRGRVPTFHLKQLAQEAARELLDPLNLLVVEIVVS
jgi:hypothetical protein